MYKPFQMGIRGGKQLADHNWKPEPRDEQTLPKLKQSKLLRAANRPALTGTS